MTQPPLPLGPSWSPITLATSLRDAWLARRPVRVDLYPDRCLVAFIVGRVSCVAVTGAWATVDGWHVPLEFVREVRSPNGADTADYAHLMHDLREQANKEA